MKKTLRILSFFMAVAVALPLAGCSVGIIKQTTYPTYTTAASTYRYQPYASLDTEPSYNPDYTTTIIFKGNSADISGNGALMSDGYLTISVSGSYVLSGSFSGQIIINTNSLADVHLFFNGLTVNSDI